MFPRPLVLAAAIVCGSFLSVAHAATECINQDAPNPLEFCVRDDGTPAVYVQQPNGRQHQYYAAYAWGSVIWLDGTDPSTAYTTSYHAAANQLTPVSNMSGGSGTASDPYVITTILDLGTSGVRLTQRFSYVNGDRTIRKTWTLENQSADTTYTDVRFFHGGDTFFGGQDAARSWYDDGNRMVYVTNPSFDNAGLMGFFANPATPAAHYFGGNYWVGYTHITQDGELPDTTDSTFLDAGYALQWNRASLAAGQSWTFEGFETWSPPGALQVLAPADDFVFADSAVERTFKVHNLTDDTLSVDVAAAAVPAGWTVTLEGASTIEVAALQVVEIPVTIQIPADATGGTSRVIEVTASSGTFTNAASTRLTVLQADYTITPTSLNFAGVGMGQTATLTLTLTNGATASPVQVGELGAGDDLAAPFSFANDTCSNATVNAGESCTVDVTFTRSATDAVNDTFAFPLLAPVITTQTIAVSAPEQANEHTVSIGTLVNGTISPTTVQVEEGSSAEFTITPAAGYHIESVTGCDGTLSGSTYTTGAIMGECQITATFARTLTTVNVTTKGKGTGGGGSTDFFFLLAALLPLFYQLSRTARPYRRAAGSSASRVQLPAMPFFIAGMAILGASLSAAAADMEAGAVRVGMYAGQARGDITESDVNSRLEAAGIDATASFDDRTRTAWQFAAGYDFSKYFGVSFGYTDLGDVGTSITGDVVDVQETLEVAARATPHSANGYELGLTARFPIFDRLIVTGRAGALRWESRYQASNIDGESFSFKKDGTDEFYGLGLEVPVFKGWNITAGYTRYQVDHETIDMAGIGVSVAIR